MFSFLYLPTALGNPRQQGYDIIHCRLPLHHITNDHFKNILKWIQHTLPVTKTNLTQQNAKKDLTPC